MQAIKTVTTADPEATLINALNTWMGSVMLCETFHADVHAGNLLVMRDGRVAFLDFGIVGRVSPVTWAAVETLAASLAQKDYVMTAKALATMKATDDAVRPCLPACLPVDGLCCCDNGIWSQRDSQQFIRAESLGHSTGAALVFATIFHLYSTAACLRCCGGANLLSAVDLPIQTPCSCRYGHFFLTDAGTIPLPAQTGTGPDAAQIQAPSPSDKSTDCAFRWTSMRLPPT